MTAQAPSSSRLTVDHQGAVAGSIQVPGDKSISHRTLLLGCLADGDSRIQGFLPSNDCLATLACIRGLGVSVDTPNPDAPTQLVVHGNGLRGLSPPAGPLNCVRSGTTMRLLAGILAGQSFGAVLTGAPQLRHRPMGRIVRPLRHMGAAIDAVDGHAPLSIRPGRLRGRDHALRVASAQVKSAVLLAGLYADGPTTIHQPGPARDHTELMLQAMGADLDISGLSIRLAPPTTPLAPLNLTVPGDVSSASFPLVTALLLPGSAVKVENVGLNPTRTGLFDVLEAMGGRVTLQTQRHQGREPVADVTVRHSPLHAAEVSGKTVVRMIDEFPLLAVAATQAKGTTVVRDAAELRVKETDSIAVIASELRKMGADITPRPDGFAVDGPTPLRGALVDSHGDHRIAMALAVAGLLAEGHTTIERTACITDSFPSFVASMRNLGAGLLEE